MSTIVTRAGKGSPLTNNEVDANFVNLNNDKIQVTGTPTTGQAPIWNGTAWVPGSTSGVTSVTGTTPLSSTGGATPNLSISQANSTTNGYLSSTDWNTFNGKPAAGSGLPTGGTAGQVLSKVDATDYNTQWIDNFSTALKIQVKNATGVTITKGSVVYASGGTGANLLVSLAQANAESTSSQTLGFVEADIVNGASGLVVVNGVITGLNTAAYTDGDPVFLSPTTPGGYIVGLANKPSAPSHLVYLGNITRSQSVNGTIQVRVQNGYELEELHNVAISSPTGEYTQELAYQASTGLWKNYTKSTSTVAEGTNLYYTDARVRLAISGAAPLSYSSSTGVFSIPAATSSANGYLTSSDWSTFNGKQATLVSGTNIKTINGSSVLGSGDLTISAGDPAGTAVAMAIALG